MPYAIRIDTLRVNFKAEREAPPYPLSLPAMEPGLHHLDQESHSPCL